MIYAGLKKEITLLRWKIRLSTLNRMKDLPTGAEPLCE
jgi:hypothetical protein